MKIPLTEILEEIIEESFYCIVKVVQDKKKKNLVIEFSRDMFISLPAFQFLNDLIEEVMSSFKDDFLRSVEIGDKEILDWIVEQIEDEINSALLSIYSTGDLFFHSWPDSEEGEGYVPIKGIKDLLNFK